MLDFLDSTFQVLSQTSSLAFLFSAAIVFSLFLWIRARAPFWIRFVGVPIVLTLTIWGYMQLDDMLGYPYWGVPAEQSVLLGYDVQREGDQLEIVLWLREKEGSRLYLVPWSQKKEEQLRKAMEGMKEGKRYGIRKAEEGDQEGQMEGEEGGSESDGQVYREGEFMLYEFEEFLYPQKALP